MRCFSCHVELMRAAGPGSSLVADRAVQMVNFAEAINSMHLNHYHGRHNALYCGRLRTNAAVCSSFQLLQLCDAAVNAVLVRALARVVAFVSAHDEVLEIDLPVADVLQPELRRHFELPAQPPPSPPHH